MSCTPQTGGVWFGRLDSSPRKEKSGRAVRNTSGLKRGGPGRPKGVPNKATREIREAARALLEDPEYLDSLKRRLKRGTAGAVEPLLYHYGYGKPKETVALEGSAVRPVVVDLLTDADIERERPDPD